MDALFSSLGKVFISFTKLIAYSKQLLIKKKIVFVNLSFFKFILRRFNFCESYKQNSLKLQENLNTKCVLVIQLLSMDLKVRFGNLLKVRFKLVIQLLSTDHPYLLSVISTDINSFFLKQIYLCTIILFF